MKQPSTLEQEFWSKSGRSCGSKNQSLVPVYRVGEFFRVNVQGGWRARRLHIAKGALSSPCFTRVLATTLSMTCAEVRSSLL